MIRNIVFDMGMVLMDFHPMETCLAAAPDAQGARQLYEALFAHPEWVRLDDGTLELDELAGRAMARLADPALRACIPGLVAGMPHNVLSPLPGMAEVVDALTERGFRVYILSNAGRMVSERREMIPRIEKFAGVVFSVEERLVKPDPALYRRLTDRYGLAPETCLFLDDLPRNVEAARNLGWQGYVFDGNIPALRVLLDALPNP